MPFTPGTRLGVYEITAPIGEGAMGQVIARRVSWSRDSRFIYAAVAEIDADVVVLRNLLPAAGASR